MYKLPLDIETELQKKYPTISVKSFINDIFDIILKKSLNSGGCSIREFGKFTTHKVFSGRVNKYLIRFKFKTSEALNLKIKDDPFLLETLNTRPKVEFNKVDEENCKSRKSLKDENYQSRSEAIKLEKKVTKNNVARNELERIIQGDM